MDQSHGLVFRDQEAVGSNPATRTIKTADFVKISAVFVYFYKCFKTPRFLFGAHLAHTLKKEIPRSFLMPAFLSA